MPSKYRVEITHEVNQTRVFLMENARLVDCKVFNNLAPSKEEVSAAVKYMIITVEYRGNKSGYIADLEQEINNELRNE